MSQSTTILLGVLEIEENPQILELVFIFDIYQRLLIYDLIEIAMLTRVLHRSRFLFSKIKVDEIKEKSYEELVDLVAKRYGNRQFKHTNTAALFQIQHHFSVINPGDWVLDIGAGPQFRWTDLALTLAENQELSHQVIANDKQERGISRPHSQYVSGNFLEEPVRTKIALTLNERKFDTVLTDVSPEFTGEIETDAQRIGEVVNEVFYFSSLFLKKGGNLVCKVLNSSSAKVIEETGKLFFHQSYEYKPSVIRPKSPVYYLIFKGFSMNHNLEAMKEFLSRYRGSAKNKIAVVKDFQSKYSWDPVKILQQKAKNDYLMMRMQGRSQKDIYHMYQDDPFIKISSIARQFNLMEKAKSEKDDIGLKKAINKFTDGKMYAEYAEVPSTRQQWVDFLQGIEQGLRKQKEKRKNKKEKNKINLQPLGDNEIYMKKSQKEEQQEPEYVYIKQDLSGDYELRYQEAFIQRQMAKIQQLSKNNNQEEDDVLDFTKAAGGKTDSMGKVFGFKDPSENPQDDFKQLKQTFQAMSDEQYMRIIQKEEGYDQQIRENVGKPVKGSRNKFRNK